MRDINRRNFMAEEDDVIVGNLDLDDVVEHYIQGLLS
jgi:hypothetical protein